MLSFADIAEATNLIYERSKCERLLACSDCGLTSVGQFHEAEIIAAVVPAYRAAIESRRDAIDERLFSLGVDPTHPANACAKVVSEGGTAHSAEHPRG